MHELKDLVPPLELCKLIPAGEFADSALMCEAMIGMASRQVLDIRIIPRQKITNNPYVDRKLGREYYIYPAPTFDEILDELHKCQEDVFVKWSEIAYHGWLVNAYSHGRNEDYQAHDERKTTAALKLWLKLKGIEYAE